MPDTTFWFATFEIEGTLIPYTDLGTDVDHFNIVKEAILDYVHSKDPVVETEDGDWYFGGPEDKGNYIVGKFGKEFVETPEHFDQDKGDFDEAEETVDAEYSQFILDFEHQLIIYTTKNRIGHNMFQSKFQQGFNDFAESAKIQIEYLENDASLGEVVSKHPVLNVKFDLEPSNPHPEDGWEDLDDEIKQMMASELGIEATRVEGESLNLEQSLLSAALKMSKTDYGQYEVVYTDGYTKTVASEPRRAGVEKVCSVLRKLVTRFLYEI